MKKYLNNKKNIIKLLTPILFVGILSLFFISFGQTKLEYYKELFSKEFGFRVYSVEEKDIDVLDNFLNTDSGYKYLIILSSMIGRFGNKGDVLNIESGIDIGVGQDTADYEDFYLEGQKRVIIICDEIFSSTFPFYYTCDRDTVNSEELFVLGNILKSDNSQNLDLYVIPERLLLSPEDREDIKEYIGAIRRSESVPLISEDADTEVGEISLTDKIKDFSGTITFETFVISVSMFLIVVLARNILRTLSKDDRKPSLSDLKNFLNINKTLSLYQRMILYGFIWALVIYGILMFTLSLKDGRGLDISYMLSYSLESLNLRKIGEYTSSGGYFRLLIFFYETVLISMVLVLSIPSFIKVFKIAFFRISNIKLKYQIGKYTVPIFVITLLAASAIFEVRDLASFLIFIIVVLTFVFLQNRRYNNFDYIYSRKEKITFVLVSVLGVLLGFMLETRQNFVEPSYKSEDLIGVSDKVVLLPYSKQLGENTLINEYNFSGSEPVFVDHHLVYSPNHSRIENMNATEFKNEGVFYIQNGDVKDIVSAIYANEELLKAMISTSPSNFFRVKNITDTYDAEQKEIQVTFSCKREDLGTDKIKADFYYVDEDGEVQSENKTLLYFPGCLEVGKPEVVKVEFDPPYVESEFFFMRLVDVLGTDIKSIEIINGSSVIQPEYFSKGRGYTVIDSGSLENSSLVPITNYIFGDSYDFSFDMNLNEEEKFDMSVPINELIKEGVLKDRFLIWSTKKYLPVRTLD